MLVDWEAVVHDLEAYIDSKPGRSFGERELTAELRGLRVRHRVTEGLPERALRLYGASLIDVLRPTPATPDSEVSGGMRDGDPHRIAATPHEEEHDHVRHGHRQVA